jgi:hypothetical protein
MQFHTSTNIRTCLTIFLSTNSLHFLFQHGRSTSLWAPFSRSLGFTAHGRSYFSNLINHIPDWLRWYMVIAVTPHWLCCFFTSNMVFIAGHFYNLYKILYFFALWFQNVVTVNRRKTNRRKPRATCIECQ